MIERYTREKMARIWQDQNRYQKWLDIELAICEAYNQLGVIPTDDFNMIKEKATFSAKRVLEIEEQTKHDVVAFIQAVSESIGAASKWIHMGVTSSDILDTAFSCQVAEAAHILLEDLTALLDVLKEKAYAYKLVPMIGRTHGIHAEPITFGLKMAHFYDEMRRNLERMQAATERVRVGKISGAVGTYAHVPPFVEQYVCEKLGLKPAPLSTQIIPRDYYAEFFAAIAIVGSSIEKMAVELRHMQRTEVGEAEEHFQKGQTGSSAMPHKRNPIASENLAGLARLLRGYALSALENIPLWHERDISHSSVERVIGPDATILLDYMLQRLTNVYRNMAVYPERMEENLKLTRGLYHSEAVLLSLMKKGLTRQDAYKIVQKIAMHCYENKCDFVPKLKENTDLREHLSSEEIDRITGNEHYFEHVDTIFKRVFDE
jgi:adenylosuccinate lyase